MSALTGKPTTRLLDVAVDTPGLGPLSYLAPTSGAPNDTHDTDNGLEAGDWLLVPVGTRSRVGLIVATQDVDSGAIEGLGYAVRPALQRLALPRLSPPMLRLLSFTARYYHRSVGQVMGTMLPAWLRAPATHRQRPTKAGLKPSSLEACLGQGLDALEHQHEQAQPHGDAAGLGDAWPALTTDQAAVVKAFEAHVQQSNPAAVLLHGVTGSGKTRVYFELMAQRLQAAPDQQVLFLVPEIGLTPQLQTRLAQAFPGHRVGVLHSGLTDRQRAVIWLAAALGQLQILVGTRMAILAPLPGLGMIVVDEEHDASYKQLEGLRYSARDLALWRAKDLGIPLLLGSASPSLEMQAQVAQGRLVSLRLDARATGTMPAPVRFIDLRVERAEEGLAPSAWRALEQTLAEGQQALVYLNRRGWAPVLNCEACGWTAPCPDCSTPAVLHKRKAGWRLICHRCGHQSATPKACPDCGNPSLETFGRGSQQLEEALQSRLPQAKLLRMDRDAIRSQAAFEEALAQIRRGEVNLLVGTQMMAKGHDFPALKRVIVVDADAQIANPDFRAPEWLFANLLQVAGRAGRHLAGAEVIIQTRYPSHPLLLALADPSPGAHRRHWQQLLQERQSAGLPPFSHLAAVRFSHARGDAAVEAAKACEAWCQAESIRQSLGVTVYPPTPRYPERQAGKTRWQIILECTERAGLHVLLDGLGPWAQAHRAVDVALEVDPLGFS